MPGKSCLNCVLHLIIFALGNLNIHSPVRQHRQFLEQLGPLVPTSQDDQVLSSRDAMVLHDLGC